MDALIAQGSFGSLSPGDILQKDFEALARPGRSD
jgi:hypothetical protein